MKSLLKYIFILVFCTNAFAQKTYKFDYLSVYEFKYLESDSISVFEYAFGNSSDNSVSLQFYIKNDELISKVQLVDFENSFVYTYKFPQKKIDGLPNLESWFKNYEKANLYLKKCQADKKYTYKIIIGESAGEYAFIIERYNRRGTKLLEKSYYKSEKTDITKNHIFSTHLKNPLYCNKIIIDFEDIITESFFVKADTTEKNNTRKLVRFEKIDLTINTTN